MYRLSAEGNAESVAQNKEMGEMWGQGKMQKSLMATDVEESNMTSSWNSNSIIYKIVHKSESSQFGRKNSELNARM